jgi:hypothetical protein
MKGAKLRWGVVACAVVLVALGGRPALARIKLTTLPVRERVEIQLDNAQATLVEEERIVTLLQGTNHIDFSWSNTAIDKGTIQFRVVDMPLRAKAKEDPPSVVRPDGKVEMIQVIYVAYPPNENALVWEVFSERPAAARIRISYLVGNLKRSFNYRAVAEQDESTLVLRKYLRLDNVSGEEFGTSGLWAGFGTYFHREVGLNEAKEMLLWRYATVPIKKTYTFDWWTGATVPNEPEQRYVEMRYVLKNDEANRMGRFPLQFGKARIFQKDGHAGEAFLGEDWGQFTPIGDEMKLYLGLARDVVVKRKVMRSQVHGVKGSLYHRELLLHYTVENFKNTPVTLDVREDMNRLRDEFCGHKDHDAQWEIIRDETTLPEGQIERADSHAAMLHIPLEAAPKGEGKVKALTVTVHVFLRNEW